MISATKPEYVSPELFNPIRTLIDIRLLNAARSQKNASPVVLFHDDNLGQSVRAALGIGQGDPIRQAELDALIALAADSAGIADLSGLEYAKNLVQLSLSVNQIEEISPLKGLTKLTHLLLDNNEIADLSPLAGLTALLQLGLNYNNISDISPINNLVRLQTLGADGNNLADVSPLWSIYNTLV